MNIKHTVISALSGLGLLVSQLSAGDMTFRELKKRTNIHDPHLNFQVSTYDSANFPRVIDDQDSFTTCVEGNTLVAQGILGDRYVFKNGRLEEYFGRDSSVAPCASFSYDDEGRVKSIAHNYSSDQIMVPEFTDTHTFYANGKLQTKTRTEDERTSVLSYATDGNLTGILQTENKSVAEANRGKGAEQIVQHYDARGRLVFERGPRNSYDKDDPYLSVSVEYFETSESYSVKKIAMSEGDFRTIFLYGTDGKLHEFKSVNLKTGATEQGNESAALKLFGSVPSQLSPRYWVSFGSHGARQKKIEVYAKDGMKTE